MAAAIVLRGLVLGFAIAAPVGPIGVLCIRRTLAYGRVVGFVSGLGAATADMVYGAIAALGLTAVASVLAGGQFWLRLLGGAFLIYLGVKTFRAQPADKAVTATAEGGLLGAYLSTVFLTLTNPATIFSFTVIFAGLGVADTGAGLAGAGWLVVGVFLGSALWWLALSGGVSLLRGAFTPRGMVWVNRLAGVIIVGFGVAALASLLAQGGPG